MGQDNYLRYHPISQIKLRSLTYCIRLRCNGRTRRTYTEKPVQLALISPFTVAATTEIPPPSALFKLSAPVTPLNHRFKGYIYFLHFITAKFFCQGDFEKNKNFL